MTTITISSGTTVVSTHVATSAGAPITPGTLLPADQLLPLATPHRG